MRVKFVDLRAQFVTIQDEIGLRVQELLASTQYILGPSVAQFEQSFAAFVGADHAIGVASGLDALRLSLQALDVGPGGEVITAANTFIATSLAIEGVGARPVLVDCHPQTYNLDPARLEAAITSRTRAIIPVHLYGQPADMDPILALARAHGIPVVEDACQAHGATYKGRSCGVLGDLGCFSFYPGKNLGAVGDGGMITTNRADLTEKLLMLRNYGQKTKYQHELKGTNSRLDALQAAVLEVKLKYLPAWNRLRQQHAARYSELLKDLGLVTPVAVSGCSHIYHLYVIRVQSRDSLLHHLTSLGIEAGIHYPRAIHMHPAHADLGYSPGSFPVSERYSEEILSLPMFPELTPAEIEYVVSGVRGFLKE